MTHVIAMTRTRATEFLFIPNADFHVVTARDPENPWILVESRVPGEPLVICKGFPLGDARTMVAAQTRTLCLVIKIGWPPEKAGAVLTLEPQPDRVLFELHAAGADLDALTDAGKFPQGIYDPVEWESGYSLRPVSIDPTKQIHLAANLRGVRP